MTFIDHYIWRTLTYPWLLLLSINNVTREGVGDSSARLEPQGLTKQWYTPQSDIYPKLLKTPRKEKRSSLGIYRGPWVGEGRGEDVNNNTDQGVSQVRALTVYCTLYTTRASECLQMIWRHIYMTSVTGVLMTQILLRHAGVPVSLIIKLTTRGGEKTSDVTYAESVLFLENQQNHLWYYWLKRRTVANESWVTVVDVMMQMTSLWSCHEVVTTDYFYSQLIRLWYSFCRCTTMDQFAYICLDGLHYCQFYFMFCVSFHRKYAARFHCFIWWGVSAFQSRYETLVESA